MSYINGIPPSVLPHAEGLKNGVVAVSAQSIPIDKSVNQQAEPYLSPRLLHTVVPRGEKRPLGNGWNKPENLRAMDAAVRAGAWRTDNVGVALGLHASKAVDLDVDIMNELDGSPLLPRLREFLLATLPPTDAVWGRSEALPAHWLYIVPDLPREEIKQFLWRGKPVLEYRAKLHSVRYGVHKETGKPIFHHRMGEPSEVSHRELERRVGFVVCVILASLIWNEGTRHNLNYPLVGYLWKQRVPEQEIEQFVEAVCFVTGDTEKTSRLADIRSAKEAEAQGRELAGLGYLLKEGTVDSDWVKVFDTALSWWLGRPVREKYRTPSATPPREERKPATFTPVAEYFHDLEPDYTDPILPGLLYRGRITILGGLSGTGKTTLAVEIADALSRGQPLWGIPLDRERVAWLDFDHAATQIQEKLEHTFGDEKRDLLRIRFYDPDGELVSLPLSEGTLSRYIDTLRQYRATVLVVDTLFDWCEVQDPNDDTIAREKMTLLRRLVEATDVAVLAIHHTKKSVSAASTSALHGAHRWAAKADVVALLLFDDEDERKRKPSKGREETPADAVKRFETGSERVALAIVKDRFGERRVWRFLAKDNRFYPLQPGGMPKSFNATLRSILKTLGETTYEELRPRLAEMGFPLSEKALYNRCTRLAKAGKLVIETRGFPAKAYLRLTETDASFPIQPLHENHEETGETGETGTLHNTLVQPAPNNLFATPSEPPTPSPTPPTDETEQLRQHIRQWMETHELFPIQLTGIPVPIPPSGWKHVLKTARLERLREWAAQLTE